MEIDIEELNTVAAREAFRAACKHTGEMELWEYIFDAVDEADALLQSGGDVAKALDLIRFGKAQVDELRAELAS
jgi:hypothetical protein